MPKAYTLEKAFRRDWINALRNTNGTDYTRIESCLYREGQGFCPIGLALYVCLDIDRQVLHDSPTIERVNESYGVPLKDLEIPWDYTNYGMESTDESLPEKIMDMNDHEGLSFESQAQWLIDNTKGVLV